MTTAAFFDDAHVLDPSLPFVHNLQTEIQGTPKLTETHRTTAAWQRAIAPKKAALREALLDVTKRSGLPMTAQFINTKLFSPTCRYVQIHRLASTKEIYAFQYFHKDAGKHPISGYYGGYKAMRSKTGKRLPTVQPPGQTDMIENIVSRDLLAEARAQAPRNATPSFYLIQMTHNPIAMSRYAAWYPTFPNYHLVQRYFDTQLQEVVGDVLALVRHNAPMDSAFASLRDADYRWFLRALVENGFLRNFGEGSCVGMSDEGVLITLEQRLYDLSFHVRKTRELDAPEFGGPHPNAPKPPKTAVVAAAPVSPGVACIFQELNGRFRSAYQDSIPPIIRQLFQRRATERLGDLANDPEHFDADYFVFRNYTAGYAKLRAIMLEDNVVPIINDVVHGLCDYKRHDKLVFGCVVTATTLAEPMTNLLRAKI